MRVRHPTCLSCATSYTVWCERRFSFNGILPKLRFERGGSILRQVWYRHAGLGAGCCPTTACLWRTTGTTAARLWSATGRSAAGVWSTAGRTTTPARIRNGCSAASRLHSAARLSSSRCAVRASFRNAGERRRRALLSRRLDHRHHLSSDGALQPEPQHKVSRLAVHLLLWRSHGAEHRAEHHLRCHSGEPFLWTLVHLPNDYPDLRPGDPRGLAVPDVQGVQQSKIRAANRRTSRGKAGVLVRPGGRQR